MKEKHLRTSSFFFIFEYIQTQISDLLLRSDYLIIELAGLACAPLWAISSILLKSQTGKMDALQINAIRGIFASAFALAILPFFWNTNDFYNLTITAIAYLLLSITIGMIVGDTFFIKGMDIIGVSRALPISIIYPIFILPFSVFFIGEKLSAMNILGIFITAGGIYLITVPKGGSARLSDLDRKQQWYGIILVLIACLCWSAGTISLKFAIANINPILAGAIRMPFVAIALSLFVYLRGGRIDPWRHGTKSIAAMGLAGILGIGVGGLLFMIGVKYAGPAKTAILSSTAPFFGIPISMFTLREKVTVKIVLGTMLCVAGIWLVI